MIKKKYRTTFLFQPSERPPLEIKAVSKPTSFRLFQITGLVSRTLWKTRFGKADDHTKGVAWRYFFETMGGLWVKVGQLVAMRTDLFEKPFTRELAKLHYRVSSFPYADVERIIEEGLGRKMSRVFSDFDKAPIAAASLAQVHKATLLRNGKSVAVKVQRPYAQEYLKQDMNIIRKLFNFLKHFEVFKTIMLDEMYWELEAMLTEEIDFRFEAANLKEARKRFKKYGIFVPDVYKSLSSEKVVVMEFVNGVTMSEFIAAKREDPVRLNAWLKKNKIKPKKVGSFLLRNVWRQVLEDNYFHGDLQPGNIMLLAKNRLALVDLGSVGTTDKETLSFYRQQLVAIGKKDYSKAADFTLLTSPNIPGEFHNDIKQSIIRGLKGALRKASLTEVDIEQKTTVHNASNDMAKELAKYKVSPNWSMLKLIRTFLTIDPSVVYLNPTIDLEKEWKIYYKEAKWRILKQKLTSVLELPANAMDSVMLFTKMLRTKAVDFRGSVSRNLLLVTSLVKWGFITAMMLILSIVLWTYIYQHYDIIDDIQERNVNMFTRIVQHLPHIAEGYWIAILIVTVFIMRNYLHFIHGLREPQKAR